MIQQPLGVPHQLLLHGVAAVAGVGIAGNIDLVERRYEVHTGKGKDDSVKEVFTYISLVLRRPRIFQNALLHCIVYAAPVCCPYHTARCTGDQHCVFKQPAIGSAVYILQCAEGPIGRACSPTAHGNHHQWRLRRVNAYPFLPVAQALLFLLAVGCIALRCEAGLQVLIIVNGLLLFGIMIIKAIRYAPHVEQVYLGHKRETDDEYDPAYSLPAFHKILKCAHNPHDDGKQQQEAGAGRHA